MRANKKRGADKRLFSLISEPDFYAALDSTTVAVGAPTPISIRRAFWASGISRTRSTWSNPFTRLAPVTTT